MGSRDQDMESFKNVEICQKLCLDFSFLQNWNDDRYEVFAINMKSADREIAENIGNVLV